ncbi:unnamed protein product, partial [Gulo gulo]
KELVFYILFKLTHFAVYKTAPWCLKGEVLIAINVPICAFRDCPWWRLGSEPKLQLGPEDPQCMRYK